MPYACSIVTSPVPSPRRRLLIVEDDEAMRAHLAASLSADPGLHVVAEASTLAEGRAHLAAGNIDVLLTDLGLPDGSGVTLIQEAATLRPGLPVMVLTVFADEKTVLSAIEAGASSYLLKNASRDEVLQAMQQLLEGGSPISPAIARHLLRRLHATPPPPVVVAAAGNLLSDREAEILRHVAKGFSSAEVAGLLGISVHTVTTHVRNVYRKLEVNSRSSAIYEAVNLGIIRLDD